MQVSSLSSGSQGHRICICSASVAPEWNRLLRRSFFPRSSHQTNSVVISKGGGSWWSSVFNCDHSNKSLFKLVLCWNEHMFFETPFDAFTLFHFWLNVRLLGEMFCNQLCYYQSHYCMFAKLMPIISVMFFRKSCFAWNKWKKIAF